MALYCEKEYELRLSDFDQYGRLLPSSVLDLFQEIAVVQSDEDGNSHESMLAAGGFWVVTRMKYAVCGSMENERRVVVSTWPHSPSKFIIMRDFSITSTSGTQLIKGSSEWMALSATDRKLAPVADFYDVTREFCTERSFNDKMKKIFDFESDEAQKVRIVPSYTDVDLNGHVNNAKYADYIVNAIDPGQAGRLTSFQIDYRHEVLRGEPLDVFTQFSDDSALVKGVDASGTVMFASKVEFEI